MWRDVMWVGRFFLATASRSALPGYFETVRLLEFRGIHDISHQVQRNV